MSTKQKTALPVLPLKEMVVFPDTETSLQVVRPFSRAAVDAALTYYQRMILAVPQKNGEIEAPKTSDFHPVGTLCEIVLIEDESTGESHLFLEGKKNIVISNVTDTKRMFTADFESVTYQVGTALNTHRSLMENVVNQLLKLKFPNENTDFNKEFGDVSIEHLPFVVASTLLTLPFSDAIALLATHSIRTLYRTVLTHLKSEIEVILMEKTIEKKVRNRMDARQRAFFLREQLDVIMKELSDSEIMPPGVTVVGGEMVDKETSELLEKIDSLDAPEQVKLRLEEEFGKLRQLSPASAETATVRGYIDTILALPWAPPQSEEIDTKYAERILERDHFGLHEIKERILEYVAVLKLTQSTRSPIICLVGPPGVGKTSIATSIAAAVKRKFVRISLGGIKDEAEIRGHRKTYVGAMPGKIIQSLKRVGTRNPVFLLDEVDKLSSDYKGDPASALLEVLDPEQNRTFVDHYLDLEFDLSQVIFVATANSRWDIPHALRDRMEIIELDGYTYYEKKNIARKYLIPKQLKLNGIGDISLRFTEAGMRTLIEKYTWEAGVRELERKIATLCRRLALQRTRETVVTKVSIKPKDIEHYLGKPLYDRMATRKKACIGVVNGLAWTQNGGTMLTVEALTFPGDGKIQVTGNLGSVMKESVQAAAAFVRSVSATLLGVDKNDWKQKDIYLHFPEGAVPKDGPSAGVAIALAIASAISERPVAPSVAMTGEITLRGEIVKIGGLKAKVMAAKNAGITTILIPPANKPEFEEIPEEIKKGISFEFPDNAKQVLRKMLLTTQ